MTASATRAGLASAVVGAAAILALAAYPPGEHERAGREGGRASAASVSPAVVRLPASPRPAFRPGKPVLLPHSAIGARWAPVRVSVVARRSPRASATPIATLRTLTPEGTSNLVVASGEAETGGRLWTRVQLPVLPNGSVGWVPRSALGGYVFVHTRLVIDRQRLVATLFRDGKVVFRAPVGVGRDQWPTPTGRFYIRDKLTMFRSPFYGPVAFGTSARSSVLTDWPGGGFVGIHGTDQPELIPGRISHGCVRLRNADLLRLNRLLPVGTPLTIR
ncbi:MAG: L,D-transpeptidase [Gaiellaceae bacterium]